MSGDAGADDLAAKARERIEASRRERAAAVPTTAAQRRAAKLSERKAAEFDAGPGVTVRNGIGDRGATERYEKQSMAIAKAKKKRRRRRR